MSDHLLPEPVPAGVSDVMAPGDITKLTLQLHENTAQSAVLSAEVLAATELVVEPLRELLEARSSFTPITFKVNGNEYWLYNARIWRYARLWVKEMNVQYLLGCELAPQHRHPEHRYLLLLPTPQQRAAIANKRGRVQDKYRSCWTENIPDQGFVGYNNTFNVGFAQDEIMAAVGQQSRHIVAQIQAAEQQHLAQLADGLTDLEQLYPTTSS